MAIVETPGSVGGGSDYTGRDVLKEYERQTAERTADMTVTRVRGLISWQAIFAGTVGALAVHLLLMMLGLAFGFGATDPITDENPIAVFTGGTAIAWGVSALLALWAGGWIAGRTAAQIDRRAGSLHGFMVWGLATAAMFVFVSTGLGFAVGGAAKAVSAGVEVAGKPIAGVASAATDIAKDAVARNEGQIKSFVSEAVRIQGAPENAPESIRATREIGLAVTRYFSADDAARPDARTKLTQALVQHGKMSDADAKRTVDEWTASYAALKADLKVIADKAEAKAREAGDKAAKALTTASIWGFFAFLIGAGASICGGVLGACAARCKIDQAIVSA